MEVGVDAAAQNQSISYDTPRKDDEDIVTGLREVSPVSMQGPDHFAAAFERLSGELPSAMVGLRPGKSLRSGTLFVEARL